MWTHKVSLLALLMFRLAGCDRAYYPPPDSEGGWRRLVASGETPDVAKKARIEKVAGVDWDKLNSAWDYNAIAPGSTGLLVIRHGWIVGEWYRDCNATTTFNIYSSSKSYVSVAFGMLLDEQASSQPAGQRLTLDTRVYNEEWLPEGLPLSDPRKASITLRQLLTMTAGIPSHVDVGEPPAGVGLYEYALGKDASFPTAKLRDDPGRSWSYSNPNVSHLVLIHHRVSHEDLLDYLKRRVLDPIRMTHYDWLENGGQGHLGPYRQGFSGLMTTPEDHARFLYLALHRGMWGARQLVPADYYSWALAPTPVNPQYGALWWLQRDTRSPADIFQTAGAHNNSGWVVPSLDLIFVRLGSGEKFPTEFANELVQRVVAAIH